ncbi:hypothetical protein EVAR_14384_1 [Eumeta japonica]|uniref:Uncharacterized protein n=1 Tax=Eumeta variegata TaxID=151549 RepID=A0A4C1TXK6_EUMVA|nr:hypothetical protein EVAR_14384_1 [Eumeta japonica]
MKNQARIVNSRYSRVVSRGVKPRRLVARMPGGEAPRLCFLTAPLKYRPHDEAGMIAATQTNGREVSRPSAVSRQ